ncbi:MAG: Glutamate-tRNA ligase [Candidatus Nomurabacteria bacterium GW2011_GWC2_41_8]|uniref:Glutamate--tRNA ligase n=2 Tax=Candidatus Nomuraibacteriota TaxID=1752729 RepID=A0A1F6YAS6_9BACT|nr:MAG: Glutamate-tRNA ligase [Candidatus Nomurabacteria bacterium GW2011_GWC2_41_8]OGI84749.1 MAG: hypothetical protein A3F49_02765 [Candidatus Nomurabacteria bacterium RIFCSPHIGHO2_12_FULL_42_19]OGI93617.1 MAG: hypothetical protein A3A07_01145 [Candidatus Nomurabacteria bacterium RIFCSPLOWO2_01_FULL_41_52]OGI99322.1 MAG: hypothetical protein A3H56_03610 [Candidatus Nomurabacteria bacterium RIFCSPLOWO2_02_FULL_42_24]OGJ03461.1 MAG: hypothetical protein A3F97_03320 [Candidatus Nomurabacteria ba
MPDNKVVTRFAPSPTGLLHLGNYRTAIFAYLYAKKNNGSFVLRIEDTDRKRSKKEYEKNIIESLKWLGLDYDKFYRQSEHVDRHQFYLEKMIKEGNAYISKEAAKDGSGVIKELVRFKNPNIDVSFKDEIKGEVTMNTKDLGDFVIAKNLGEPLFHLAVVVDDFEAGVTHVIRGEDHVSNTPRQVLIGRAIGAPTPIYAHMPLVLAPDRLKLSKRRGALPLTEYKNRGFLPEAILNGVAFVGWNPGTEKEIFTRDELIEAFELSRVQKSPAVFSEEKLEWFNKEHMKLLSPEEIEKNILEQLPDNMRNKKIIPIIFERISKWGDVKIVAEKLAYLFNRLGYSDVNLPIWRDLENHPEKIEKTLGYLKSVLDLLKVAKEENWNYESLKNTIWDYSGKEGRGNILWPLRFALSGEKESPDPFELAEILGRSETLDRIERLIKFLEDITKITFTETGETNMLNSKEATQDSTNITDTSTT